MSDETNGNGKTSNMINVLYRAALLSICGWVLVTVLAGNERGIKMEGDIRYFNSSVSRIEGAMRELVTKDQLDLKMIQLRNEQLTFQNEFLKVSQSQQPPPTTKR